MKKRTDFIGRIQEQRQFRVALAGLLAHHQAWQQQAYTLADNFRPEQAPVDESYTRLFLLHGIGGIGKSWLVRRCLVLAAEETAPRPLSLYEDVSVGAPVLEPVDLLDRLARLIETEEPEATAAYRQAQTKLPQIIDRISRYRLEQREVWANLRQTAQNSIPAPDPAAFPSRADFEAAAEAAILSGANRLLVEHMIENGRLSPVQAELFRRPAVSLAARLRAGVERIIRRRPVIIALDNLEIIVPLEPFIRDQLVMPTIAWPIFWLLSGRHNLADERPVELESEARRHKGYRDLLGENPPLVWDMSAFGDADLEAYLEQEADRRRVDLTIDEELIAAIKTASSGVPLVVEIVADALFSLDRDEFLQKFSLADPGLLPADRLEQITGRFLRYCMAHPQDLSRAQGLAMLRRGADEAALAAIWELSSAEKVAAIRQGLRARYAFIQAGGLHDTVYAFVRRQLHRLPPDQPPRRSLSERALAHYQRQWAQSRERPVSDSERQSTARDLLNARLWRDPEQAMPFFLARFVEGLGFDRSFADDLLTQAEMFLAADGAEPALASLLPRLRAGLEDAGWFFDEPGQAAARMIESLLETPDIDPLSLSILYVWWGGWLIGEGRLAEALTACQTAAEHLPPETGGLRRQLGHTFYRLSDRLLWPDPAAEPVSSPAALQAAQQAVDLNPTHAEAWHNLGLALEYLGREAEALPAYRRAIELEPKATHYRRLGDIQTALERPEAAITAYQQAINLDPDEAMAYYGLGFLYGERGEYEEALSRYQAALVRQEGEQTRAATWDGLGDIYGVLGRYEEAIDAYQQALRLNPAQALSWHSLGDIYRRQQRYDEAIDAYQQAIKLDESYGPAYHRLGLVYHRLGDDDRARSRYREALARLADAPSRAAVWHRLAELEIGLDRYEAAIDAGRRAIDLNPQEARPWGSLAEAYLAQADYEAALEAYRRFLDRYPEQAAAWRGLGNAHTARRQYEAAIDAYRRAIELEPTNGQTYNNLAYLYYRLDRYEAALEAYRQALAHHTDNHSKAVSWDNLGNIHRVRADYAVAIAAYRRAISLEAGYAWPYHNLAETYVRQGQYEPAIEQYRHALERHQSEADRMLSELGLAEAYRLDDRPQEAIPAYRRVVERDPDRFSAWYRLGQLYRRLDRWDEAAEASRRASQLKPERAGPYHELGLIHEQRQEYPAAIEQYRRALKRDSQRADSWLRLGDLYRRQGEATKAGTAYRRAVQLKPRQAEPYDGLGRIHEENGAYEAAIEAYRRAADRHTADADRALSLARLADLYRRLERDEAAIDAYRSVVQLTPAYAPAWHQLGQLYLRLERVDEALTPLKRAVELDPTDGWSHHRLGYVYAEQGEPDRAIAHYRQAVERHQSDEERAAAWYQLGRLYQEHQRDDEAIEAYEQTLALEPERAAAWERLADLHRRQNRPDEAIETYREAIELDPAPAWPYHKLGLIYADRGETETAIHYYRQAIDRHRTGPDRAVSWNNLGNACKSLNRYDEAIEAYRRALELDPACPWPYHNLAFVYAEQGLYDQAIPLYRRAIEQQPLDRSRAVSWDGLANVFTILGRFDEAIEAYQQAIELDPAYALPWHSLGQIHQALGRSEEALTAYQRAIELDPEYAPSRHHLGDLYRALEREGEAVNSYIRAIELDRDYPWPYHRLAEIYAKQGKHERAIDYYEKALERHQANEERAIVWHNLGDIYRSLNRPEPALTAYRRAIALNTEYAPPWHKLGLISAALGREKEAITAYRRAIELDPAGAWPYHNLALIHEKKGEAETALTLYRQAIDRHQTDLDRAVSWHNLGGICLNLGRYREAEAAYHHAIGLDPDFALPWNGLGDLHSEMRRYPQAIEAYRRAIDLDPNHAPAYNDLGFAYEQAGQPEQAIAMYRHVIENHPGRKDRSVAWNNLGNIHRARQEIEEAIEAYRRAIDLAPAFAWPYHNLGAIYEQRGEHEQALALYRQAARRKPGHPVGGDFAAKNASREA